MAPGRAPLTYGRLREHVTHTVGVLNHMGYGRNDRIAIVLPNGPDMASAFLSVASGATCAPLNPLYSPDEFEFYLSDLQSSALIVQSGEPSHAITAARKLNVPVIELKPLREAGLFELSGERGMPAGTNFSGPGDTAIILHTSGTTSRPKRVPLTHANLCASAYNITGSLRLDKNDRCLNVMPLFHIHGLVGALLSSVLAGGSTVCTPGFIAPEFSGWLREFRPTWYTAVPTIHQKILELARNDPALPDSLRFIRSASSALPVSLMRGLEERFGVPVIEAYGMTEASHQIAANPLPPLARKPGSVGLPWGSTDVAILDEAGNMLQRDQAGEVAIRGPGVTAGYENAPEANASAFHAGWLRTGDTGYVDATGYVHLLGRLKEIINRGGEKVSPFEVEEALLAYPRIKEAIVFPVKSVEFGEEVGAAVVAGDGLNISDLKDFLSACLAYFKIPSFITTVESIPKGPTGKVQRIGMAERLGLPERNEKKALPVRVAPLSGTETEIARIWSEVLHRADIGMLDNFLELGGDSLLATQVMSRIRQVYQIEIPIVSVIDAENLSSLAAEVERRRLKAGGAGSEHHT
jgi:acyl-CoA synthetase (AMP-forming)/AMP-acid ligase II/acyl carrier protein